MTVYVLHWRSYSTYNEGVSTMQITDRELAHHLLAGLNDLQDGYCHWWFVAQTAAL